MITNGKPVGAVLVVGGGISGIQTALDLAESGFYVYLAESSSAIGGRMAQLDKTFPTNDCAMCMLSPKLVEVGRHHNVQVLPDMELIDLEGEPGRFMARLRCKPRYVDIETCIGCDECTKVCPVSLPSEFDEGLGTRKAIYRLYPQAIPNVFTISRLGAPACEAACPIHQNAHGYVSLIAEGKYHEALDVILRDNPLPSICGRVCVHPCEDACVRAEVDEPISIAALKRFVVDQVGDYQLPRPDPDQERTERIAIVGAGPAGLTCAYDLRQRGYQTTIYESLPVAGGMLAVGIPEHRLPEQILKQEIARIEATGVEIQLNSPIGKDENTTLEDLREGYDAVFIGIGAHLGWEMDIPGEELAGVYKGVEFLRRFNLGEAVEIGDRVIIVGGGDVAIDSARTAKRLGAEQVTIVYRRSRAEMPAHAEEIEETLEEGIDIQFLTTPIRAVGDEQGRLREVECLRMELGEPDESGRRRPVPIAGSEFTIPCDMLLISIGQMPDARLAEELGLDVSRWDLFNVDPVTSETNVVGVFSGGDCVTGPDVVVTAMAAGKKAAESIHRYLNGLDLYEGRELEGAYESEIEVDTAGEPVQARAQLPKLNTERRITGFEEVHLGLSEAQAYQEALRCLHCSVCSDCRLCAEVCEPKAIDYQMEPEVREIEVGAVILATGLKAYDAQSLGEYGFGRYTNVVTSLQFERLLSASGPTGGHLLRPSDARAPRKVAWIQCVGSRDLRHLSYCSAVCCMYATKEAVVAKEHDAQIEPTIFYMDLRAYGKGFSQLVQRARDQGVRYVRSLISQVIEFPETKNLLIRYRDASGEFKEEEFDLVVLSVGLQPHPKGQDLAQRLGVELDAHGFIKAADSNPVATSQLGIFATGVATGPKDIPEVIIQASAAAAAAGELLAPACGTCIQEKRYPEELAVDGGPRIGVFICHCGSNIAGVVDVKAVAERAATLPGVVHAENVLYACSQDNLKYIKQLIQEKNLNRIVVASCTPRNLEGLFQDTIRESGLNQFLFEMVNIREQCSWVHPDQPEQATDKAKVLVRMSVAKARHLKPLHLQKVPIIANALVIGGGMSGMVAALTLADQGFSTYLVAHGGELGDDLKRVYRTPEGTDVQGLRDELIQRVRAHERIRLFMESEIVEFSGFVGNFRTCLRTPEGETTLEHGAVVVALEGGEHQTEEYLYGRDERILTQRGLERMIHQKPQALQDKKTVVMIQCVGRDAQRPYCSRICCGEAIKNALALANDPERRVYVLYREMMAYGLLEDLYREARERGIVFIRHEEQEPSQVECQNGKILVTVRDARLGQDIRIPADLVALSTGVVPDPMTETLSQTFKVPIDAYGFFSEAHIKLRPVDFASHGLFVCGLSHAPNTILELIAKAQAAAGRAATILSKSHLEAGGVVAIVDREKCTSCLTCLRECPYGAISVDGEGIAVIDPARCQGCGICAADCPAKAIQLQQFEDRQEISMLAELLTAGR